MGLEGNTVRNLEGRKKSPTLLITTTSSKWLRLSHKKNKNKNKKTCYEASFGQNGQITIKF